MLRGSMRIVAAATVALLLAVPTTLGASTRALPEGLGDGPDVMGPPRAALGYRKGRPIRLELVTVGWAEVEVKTARAFLAMQAAAGEAGVELWIRSGFRSHEHQAWLYRAFRQGFGNRAARPGHSNHQSGRALDLRISEPGTLAWLDENARRYGFRRTVRGEPWHWEYVGTAKKKRRGGSATAARRR
jgi:zinc D-Ala-D-Ala carboxypeptidase